MSIKINFDAANNPEEPTIILAKRNGDRIGKINAKSIELTDNLNDAAEMSFTVYKYVDGVEDPLWSKITNFKLVYCVEWNQFFEIAVEVNESTDVKKTVSCTALGSAELGQIMLYGVEINTETDISRDAYEIPTVLYNPDHPEASLLHRIMGKAPHYTVKHVDATIAKIQRTFTFDGKSIYDAFQEIAEEIDCLFVFSASLDSNNKLAREISVYDLESNCTKCGNRDEFVGKCPKCGSMEITEGYGEDTAIFVTADELGDNIQLSTETKEIKNCFKLEAGDDLMNATIKSCNPNGSDYIWYLSDAMKEDMSDELTKKIESYDNLYAEYQKNDITLNKDIVDEYNKIVDKYYTDKNKLGKIPSPISGYPSLIQAYYNTMDLYLYLNDSMMPDAGLEGTTAEKEVTKLEQSLSSASTSDGTLKSLSVYTADNIVLSLAKVIVDSRYKVKVVDNSSGLTAYSNAATPRTWKGKLEVTSYSNDEDSKTTKEISVKIDEKYETFVKQKIDKILNKGDSEDVSISGLFKKELEDFKIELTKYSRVRLSSFYDACQSCIDILVEQGVADNETWGSKVPNLYEKMYVPYVEKLSAISNEMSVRQGQIDIVVGVHDENGDVKTRGLQDYIKDEITKIQNALDFQKYLGSDLWLEFCSFRRDDKYSNDNYISDGLGNAQLIAKAKEFIEVAQKEIYKSAELQRSITSNLKNLLVMEKFKPLVEYFEVGNWIRILVDDEVYRLRLTSYTIDYDDLSSLSVEFADEVRAASSIRSVQDVLSQASTMATSYSSVKRQAKQGEKSNDVIDSWFENGLNATNTKIIGGSDNQSQVWDDHGMLFRKFNLALNDYEPTQMKIVNSTLAITDDNWNTTKTAVGQYYYFDDKGNMQTAYGINAETIIGKLFLGEQLKLNNPNGTMSFDDSGFMVSNKSASVTIDPDDSTPVFAIKNKLKNQNVFVVNTDGSLTITGKINATDVSFVGGNDKNKNITGLADIAFDGKYTGLTGGTSSDNGKALMFDKSGKVVSQKIAAGDVSGLPVVATTGRYDDLLGKPSLSNVATSGKYSDLTGAPLLSAVATSGKYSDLSDVPDLKTVATSGKYTDLAGNASDAGKLLYVNTDGSVTTISIAELKTKLS